MYYAEFYEKYTGLHIPPSRSNNSSLCRIELSWGQVWYMSYVNVLKIEIFQNLLHFETESKSRFNSDEIVFSSWLDI